MGIFDQILSQYQNDQQQNNGGLIQSILSGRFQPNEDDTARSITQTAQSYGAPDLFKPVTPEQQANTRMTNELTPFTTAMGLQSSAADIGLKNAQSDYYGNALGRDLAEKKFQYENDPQMAQAKMMAAYMASLGGQSGTPANAPPTNVPTGNISPINASSLNAPAGGPIPPPPTPQNLSQQMQSNGQPSGGGFNPMGAMLAKNLGLTDMQIGPNGQPMPIPGSMKVENGSVISFDQNGKPQSNIPVNPRAQGLFEQKLQDIAGNVNKLHDIGGMVDENNGWLSNKATQLAASQDGLWGVMPGGQTLLQGTPAQTLRDNINADVKQALPLYMQAFGITPGMERAQAAQQMLQDAIGGSLTKSRQHTMANLKNLSQTAGTGELAQRLSTSIPTINSPDDPVFQQLPPGAQFLTQDGRTMVKH